MTEEQNSVRDEPDYFLALNLGSDIGHKQFTGPGEFVEWAQRQREAFIWLRGVNTNDNRISPAHSRQWLAVDRLFGAAERTMNAADGGERAQAISDVHRIVQKHFNDKIVLSADDPRALFLADLAKQAPELAAMALGFFTKTTGIPGDLQQLDAYFRALAFEAGLSNSAQSELGALQLLRNQWSSETSRLNDTVAHGRKLLADHSQNEKVASDLRKDTFDKDQEARSSSFKELVDRAESRLEGIARGYSDELAMSSAVDYWRKKAWVHRILAAASAVATLVAGLVYFGLVLPVSFKKLLGHLGVIDQAEWKAGIAVALVLVGIWLVRILVRMFFSQVHLAADSSHRKITVLTYLALLKNEQQAVSAEDRSLVLSTIFRPISDGIIRDDAMPTSPWELLTRPPKAQ